MAKEAIRGGSLRGKTLGGKMESWGRAIKQPGGQSNTNTKDRQLKRGSGGKAMRHSLEKEGIKARGKSRGGREPHGDFRRLPLKSFGRAAQGFSEKQVSRGGGG